MDSHLAAQICRREQPQHMDRSMARNKNPSFATPSPKEEFTPPSPKEEYVGFCMKNVQDATDEELRSELQSRNIMRAEKAAKEKRAREETFFLLLTSPEAKALFMMLLPEHTRTTCKGDEFPANVDRCTRCTAIDSINGAVMPDGMVIDFR